MPPENTEADSIIKNSISFRFLELNSVTKIYKKVNNQIIRRILLKGKDL